MGRDHLYIHTSIQHILILYIIPSFHHPITSSSFILLYRFIIIFSIYDYWLKLRSCPGGKPRPFTHPSRRYRFHKQEIQFGVIKWRRLWKNLAFLVYFKIRKLRVRCNQIKSELSLLVGNLALIKYVRSSLSIALDSQSTHQQRM